MPGRIYRRRPPGWQLTRCTHNHPDHGVRGGMSEIEYNRQEAIPLVRVAKDDTFVVGEEALDMLKSISGNVAVVAVAGMYRTGKSYLLNKLFVNGGGFTVGHTHKACTKGIWIWGSPLKHTLPNGEEVTVIVLDTEGINSIDSKQTHDARIFSLAVLLSSYFIFNSVGKIDENAIDDLSLIVNLTKHIHTKSCKEEDGTQFAQYFPSFMWIVRDFMLQLVENGREITARDYLESSLRPQPGFSEQTASKNRIRNMLTAFFKDRDCATLVRPVEEEVDLQNLDAVPYESLREEFRDGLEALRRRVFSALRPKQLDGHVLTGSLLASMVKSYVQAINDGGVPTIATAWEHIVRERGNEAVQKALDSYLEGMTRDCKEVMPLSAEDLRGLHSEHKNRVLSVLEKDLIGDEKEEFKEKAMEIIRREKARLEKINEECSRDHAAEVLKSLYSTIDKSFVEGKYENFHEYEMDRAMLAKEYYTQARGTNTESVWIEFMDGKIKDAVAFFERQASKKYVQEQSRLEQRVAELEEDLYKTRKKFQVEVDDLQEKLLMAARKSSEAFGREEETQRAFAEVRNKYYKLERENDDLRIEVEKYRELEKHQNSSEAMARAQYEKRFSMMQRDHENVYNEIVSHIDAALRDLGHPATIQ